MNDKPIKITLTGKVAYQDSLTVSQAAEIIAFLNNATTTSPSLPGSSTPTRHLTGNRGASVQVASAREALNQSGAKTNPEKIVALAAYILQDGSENFRLESIKPLFQRAREAAPKNLTRDLDVAIRSGWIVEAETKGEYFLPVKTEGVLSTGFDSIRGKRSTGSRPRSSPLKKSATSTIPAAFEDIEEFPDALAGVPSYHDLSTQRNKMLFVIKVAKDLDKPGLDTRSIVWLSDRYGEAIAPNNVSNYYKSLQKAGLVNKTVDGSLMRITPKGETFLKSLSGENPTK